LILLADCIEQLRARRPAEPSRRPYLAGGEFGSAASQPASQPAERAASWAQTGLTSIRVE